MVVYETLKSILDISAVDVMRALRRKWRARRTGRLRLSSAQLTSLELMRQDNRGAGPPFSASKHWQMLAAQFENALRSEQLSNPEEQSFNLSFSGFAPTDLRLHRYVCWLYRRALKQRDSLGLLDRLRATCRKGRG